VRIRWAPAALWLLYELPLHSATLVDRAVLRFAEKGLGEVFWEAPYFHLRAGLHDVVFTVDREARVLNVLRIHRAPAR
jgi:hypothetical protein